MEPEAVPGTPWEGEISLGNSPGGPPEDHNDFLFGSEGLWERFGSPPGRQNKDFMLRSLFFRLREAPGIDFGAILARFGSGLGSILELFLERF